MEDFLGQWRFWILGYFGVLWIKGERLDPRVVHDFAEAAATGDDIIFFVEAGFFVPAGAGDGVEDVGGRAAAVEAQGVDEDFGVVFMDAADELGGDN